MRRLRPIGPPFRHGGWVRSAAFGSGGRVALTGGSDGTASLWNTVEGRLLGPPLHHGGDVVAVAFSPDEQTLLTGSADGVARLWDRVTGRSIGPGMTHRGPVNAIAFAPDGHTVLTGGFDRLLRRWDVPSPVAGRADDLALWVRGITGITAADLPGDQGLLSLRGATPAAETVR